MSLDEEMAGLRAEIAVFRAQLVIMAKDVTLASDKMHGFPCPALLASLTELQDKHIRPLEDREERRRGVFWLLGVLASVGAVEAVRRWIQ